MTRPASLLVTGSVELQLDTLAERVARRVVELLTERDPHQGGGQPGRGEHTPDELGLGGLAETTTAPKGTS